MGIFTCGFSCKLLAGTFSAPEPMLSPTPTAASLVHSTSEMSLFCGSNDIRILILIQLPNSFGPLTKVSVPMGVIPNSSSLPRNM